MSQNTQRHGSRYQSRAAEVIKNASGKLVQTIANASVPFPASCDPGS